MLTSSLPSTISDEGDQDSTGWSLTGVTWITYPSLDLEEGRKTWVVVMQLVCPSPWHRRGQIPILIQRTEDEDGGSSGNI